VGKYEEQSFFTVFPVAVSSAFGTGGHGTTEGCLVALEKSIKGGETVLDVGTGTGILAIAARKLGAGHVTAIEIDPVACREAVKNIALNGIDGGIDAADTVSSSLSVFAEMLKSVTIHKETMRRAAEDGFITATDLADYLVRKGMPFREAHEAVGRSVLRAIELGCGLASMPLVEYQQLSPLIADDVYDALSVDASVSRRKSYGGTAQTNLSSRLRTLMKRP